MEIWESILVLEDNSFLVSILLFKIRRAIMETVLKVDGLTKLYNNGRGVRDISFEVYKGEVFGFLGPNGAGKTTVMKSITGLNTFKTWKG